jgi:hypothetical protein
VISEAARETSTGRPSTTAFACKREPTAADIEVQRLEAAPSALISAGQNPIAAPANAEKPWTSESPPADEGLRTI